MAKIREKEEIRRIRAEARRKQGKNIKITGKADRMSSF